MASRDIRIGLCYNLRKDYIWSIGQPNDMDADWDVPETVGEIQQGLERNGFHVINLDDPKQLLADSRYKHIHIVFSICEMQGYRFRESIVPSLCELLALPYVFSPPDTMMISLDKNLCNLIVKQAGCMVPEWYLIRSAQDLIDHGRFTSYPYIVKPSAEGSGIGINEKSVVHTYAELCSQIDWVIESYHQPVLLQKYMSGREFTVGILEVNNRVSVLSPLEVSPQTPHDNFTYNVTMKELANSSVNFTPLQGEPKLEEQIVRLAEMAYRAIGCRDAARVDIRLSDTQVPHFLEINPLPHLHPINGDFCRSAQAKGLTYDELIGSIMHSALSRYNL